MKSQEEYANMFKVPKLAYNEMKQTSVDYSSVEQVQRYDDIHQRFRDYEKDSDAIIKLLELGSNNTVIDMGAGTGAFAPHAAKHFRKIYGAITSSSSLEIDLSTIENSLQVGSIYQSGLYVASSKEI